MHLMAYDAARDRTVLTAGKTSSAFLIDTWEWDGTTWTPQQPAQIFAPIWSAAAYDAARAHVVMFGGAVGCCLVSGQIGCCSSASDTAIYHTFDPAGYTPFGAGCSAGGTIPSIGAAPFSRPWIGDTFTLELAGLVPGAPVAMAFGTSSSIWGALVLPFPLSMIGSPPGCFALVSGEIFVPVANTGGTAELAVPIPPDPGLVGGVFYNQGWTVDTGRVVVSDAATARVGER
jgi:hypothetical protein